MEKSGERWKKGGERWKEGVQIKQNDRRMATVQQISEIGWDYACKKKKMSNVERRMSNVEV